MNPPQGRDSRSHGDGRPPQQIRDVLTDLLARRGYSQITSHEECQQAWAATVGELDQFSRATEIRRGVLFVLVSNSVVLQELTFRKSELVSRLADALPKHKISDVRFKVGNIH